MPSHVLSPWPRGNDKDWASAGGGPSVDGAVRRTSMERRRVAQSESVSEVDTVGVAKWERMAKA